MPDLTADPGDRAAVRVALHAPFRGRRSTRIAWAVAVAQAVVLLTVTALLPSTGPVGFQWYDRLGMVAVTASVAWMLSRFALISARPSERGLHVRNLFVRRDLEWAEVVQVRFGGGAPWVTLDLADGDTHPVMAIQRADGAYGAAEAKRLATLVALHTRTAGQG